MGKIFVTGALNFWGFIYRFICKKGLKLLGNFLKFIFRVVFVKNDGRHKFEGRAASRGGFTHKR